MLLEISVLLRKLLFDRDSTMGVRFSQPVRFGKAVVIVIGAGLVSASG